MSDQPIVGFQPLDSTGSDLSAHEFLIEKFINRIATTTLAKVTAVTNSGGVSAVGFVDVIPMVHQVDGSGNPTPHGEIHHLPYFRVQGGTDAVILDPKVGDIGIAVFCSRDISAVKRQKKEAAPGSRRRHDWADGLFLGGVLNGVPSQYVRFSTTGIDIVTLNNITINAANATLDSSGNLAVKGEVTADMGASKVTLTQHVHGTGTPAAGTTIATPGH